MPQRKLFVGGLMTLIVGAVAGWLLNELWRHDDHMELFQRRAVDAELDAEMERQHREHWESMPTEKKIKLSLRRARRDAPPRQDNQENAS